MARIRTVKPDFWTDGNMIGLSFATRLFYIGTWNFSLCDRGHLPDDPVGLKLKILPADDVDPRALLGELLAAGRLVRRRAADGRSYLFNPRLSDHQKSDPRWQTRCPHCTAEQNGGYVEESPTPPPLTEPRLNSGEPHRDSPEPAETPMNSAQGSKGGDGIGEEVPPTAGGSLALVPAPEPATTQALIGEWLDHCTERPPKAVIGPVSKQVKALLDEGITPRHVRAGLAAWHQKGLNPSTLPSVVNEVMQARPNGHARASPRPSTTDSRVQAALDIGAELRQEAQP